MALPVRRRRRVEPQANAARLLLAFVSSIVALALFWHVSRTQDAPTKFDNDDILSARQKQATEVSLVRSKTSSADSRAASIQLRLADISSLELLRQRGTAQNHAYSWLIDDDGLHDEDIERQVTGDTVTTTTTSSHLLQRYILALLYFSLGGNEWKHPDVFLKEQQHECQWMLLFGNQGRMGVLGCNEDMEITNLFLVDNNLVGSLPSEIRYLSKLTTLDLQHNQLEGEIPEQLGYLTTLEYLGLSRNRFEGKVPNTLGGIDALEQLLVHDNNLVGSIPESICRLRMTGVFYNLWTDCQKPDVVCHCCTMCCNEEHHCGPVEVKTEQQPLTRKTAEIPAVIAVALQQKEEEEGITEGI